MLNAAAEVPDFSQPCVPSREGLHAQCAPGLCGCLADHPDDEDIMRGFKRVKRLLHPEREEQVRGGW